MGELERFIFPPENFQNQLTRPEKHLGMGVVEERSLLKRNCIFLSW